MQVFPQFILDYLLVLIHIMYSLTVHNFVKFFAFVLKSWRFGKINGS